MNRRQHQNDHSQEAEHLLEVTGNRMMDHSSNPGRRRAFPDSEQTDQAETRKKFPWLLHQLLADVVRDGREDIVSWRPGGTAFKVHKRDEFTDLVLPNYFRQTKFKSFVRQLNLWGFAFLDQGPDRGSCTSWRWFFVLDLVHRM